VAARDAGAQAPTVSTLPGPTPFEDLEVTNADLTASANVCAQGNEAITSTGMCDSGARTRSVDSQGVFR